MASIVLAVSIKVSPFATDEPPDENSIVSAPNRLAANEKLLRVRVLFSKKTLAIVQPRSKLSFSRLAEKTA